MYAGIDENGTLYKTDIIIDKTLINDVLTIGSVKLYLCPAYYEQSTQFSFNNEVVTITETGAFIPLDITGAYERAINSLIFTMQQDRFTTGLVAFYPTGSTSDFPPYLEIDYVGELASIPTHRSVPSIPEIDVSVNVGKGDMTAAFCAVDPQNSIMGVDIHGIYKPGVGEFGFGKDFIWNLNESFTELPNNAGCYKYIDGEGKTHIFQDEYYYFDFDRNL